MAIHNWVRNTIDWQPTWGALQNADSVLASQRGNAHDIASLTVALLRASKIPARYQWGTIELPAPAVMNWVGGVTKPEAALNLLYQGGIAARGTASAGRVASIRMEHVWVNAYVNHAPSRGAMDGGAELTPKQHVNPNAALNAWLPIDGAYKQYSYSQGMDLKTQVPLDANALLDAARQGASVNEQEGWVQNLNQQAIQSQMTAYQNRLKSHIDSQKPNATVGDVIGKKIIPERMPPMLATTRYGCSDPASCKGQSDPV
ncbi:transglutaminase-like domain-containing protein [Ottowia testudinis]|uniref:transglutaminase-like domain-containing protein n=1 Tax=Ottowia testudinis TaxID=2816950 RepID=UPI001FB12715|nr:transglutaminase domain-containing protein [Ottowia testudinis]